MARIVIFVLTFFLNCGMSSVVSQAQLRGGATAREPARVGLLGGLREAREERLRREEQAATAALRAAAAQRNTANVRANANNSGLPAGVAANNTLRREPTPNTNSSLIPSSNSSNSLLRPSPVIPATSTAIVPRPVRYDGPGVAIRSPKDSVAVVNYLVDDVEVNSIRPGEQQVLDTKGSYIVRYSRGVTPDGRSFGESRYTITEGGYRFELTSTGWELYRESESDIKLAPANRLESAESQVIDRRSSDLPLPQPSSQSELRRILPTESLATEKPASSLIEPIASEPVANEEVLPAPKPRSILE